MARADFSDAGFATLSRSGFIVGITCAWDVVNGIAHQSHDVRDSVGRNAHQFFDHLFIDDQIAFCRVEQTDRSAHELHQVLVASDYVDLEILLPGLACQRADYVVGFVAWVFKDGQPHGVAIAANEGHLNGKLIGHRGALGFVGGKKLVAKGRRGVVVNNGKVIGAAILVVQQSPHHGGKEIGDFRWNSAAGLQPLHGGKKGAEDIAHGVD